MRTILNIVGILLGIGGLVWFFQGIGVLPGSFMSGDSTWTIIGSVTVVVAAGLLYLANRKPRGSA